MIRTAFTALLLAVTAAAPGAAQEDGVFVDPDSPAGKEYAIPLEQARRDAAGGGGAERVGGSGASGGQPLFGVGIERAQEATKRGNGEGSSRGGVAGATAKGGDDSARAQDLVVPNARSSAAIEAAASEGSEALLTGGVAAAVLAAGLLAGFGLRRLLRSE